MSEVITFNYRQLPIGYVRISDVDFYKNLRQREAREAFDLVQRLYMLFFRENDSTLIPIPDKRTLKVESIFFDTDRSVTVDLIKIEN